MSGLVSLHATGVPGLPYIAVGNSCSTEHESHIRICDMTRPQEDESALRGYPSPARGLVSTCEIRGHLVFDEGLLVLRCRLTNF